MRAYTDLGSEKTPVCHRCTCRFPRSRLYAGARRNRYFIQAFHAFFSIFPHRFCVLWSLRESGVQWRLRCTYLGLGFNILTSHRRFGGAERSGELLVERLVTGFGLNPRTCEGTLKLEDRSFKFLSLERRTLFLGAEGVLCRQQAALVASLANKSM